MDDIDGEEVDEEELVFGGDDPLTWGDVSKASGADCEEIRTRGDVSRSKASGASGITIREPMTYARKHSKDKEISSSNTKGKGKEKAFGLQDEYFDEEEKEEDVIVNEDDYLDLGVEDAYDVDSEGDGGEDGNCVDVDYVDEGGDE